MKRNLIIFIVVFVVIIIALSYLKNNIQKNIVGTIESFKVLRIYDVLAPKIDLNIKFKIVNNSLISFTIRDFKVKIFDNLSGLLISENEVLQKLNIPKGESIHDTKLLSNEVLGNLSNILNDVRGQLKIIVSFRVFLVKIEFEELITI